jgi:hypothetical protein
MPEFVEGALQVRHVHAPWGKFAVYSVTTVDGDSFDIDEKTIEVLTPDVLPKGQTRPGSRGDEIA